MHGLPPRRAGSTEMRSRKSVTMMLLRSTQVERYFTASPERQGTFVTTDDYNDRL